MGKFLDILEKGLKAVVILLIGFLMLWVCALVPTRYLFNHTPAYGEELSRYVFVWIVFLCLPILARTGGHMAIETITARLSGFKLKVCRLTADVFTLIFLAIMIWQGGFMIGRASFQTSPGLGLSMSWVYLSIPLGCGIMFLNVLRNFLSMLSRPSEEAK